MVQKIISKIIELIIRAQELATSIGIPNILQPGLVKEMIISETLGHKLIASKRDADAHDKNNLQLNMSTFLVMKAELGN